MKRLLLNRNLYVVLSLILIAAVLLLIGKTLSSTPAALPADTVSPTESAAPADDGTITTVTDASGLTSAGYVCITVKGESGWFELPAEEDASMTLSGDGWQNVIRFFPDGVVMESSTCDNQLCVQQAEVTLSNKDSRALTNMIICLPHEISIELYAREELAQMMEAE